MSTTRETTNAKTGKRPADKFDNDAPHLVLEGVGRLQHRRLTTVLFALDSDDTFPCSVTHGVSVGPKYRAEGKAFNADGSIYVQLKVEPAAVTGKSTPATFVEQKVEPAVAGITEGEDIPSEADMGV